MRKAGRASTPQESSPVRADLPTSTYHFLQAPTSQEDQSVHTGIHTVYIGKDSQRQRRKKAGPSAPTTCGASAAGEHKSRGLTPARQKNFQNSPDFSLTRVSERGIVITRAAQSGGGTHRAPGTLRDGYWDTDGWTLRGVQPQ